jgi:hypothetical protein
MKLKISKNEYAKISFNLACGQQHKIVSNLSIDHRRIELHVRRTG